MIPPQPHLHRRRGSSLSLAQLERCKHSMCHDGTCDADDEEGTVGCTLRRLSINLSFVEVPVTLTSCAFEGF
uniref:Uncharacterized protein n=1 Tax=Salix viminalis TaxID=40686 RepID=A0A6N2LAU8_SALVM